MAQNDMTSVGGLICSSTPLICVEPVLSQILVCFVIFVRCVVSRYQFLRKV